MMTPSLETQISDCMRQIQQKQDVTYSIDIQKLAQLRLMDFSPLLAEWTIEDNKAPATQKPLPNVDKALKTANLPSEHINKLLNYLKQSAKQGSTTAMLYLAYLYAIGKFTPQNPKKAIDCANFALKHDDYRAARLLGEMLAFAPAVSEDVLQNEVRAAAEIWIKKNSQLIDDKNNFENLITQYLHNPIVIKFFAKQKLQQAQSLGSPTADKRLRGLSLSGILTTSTPARQYQSIELWLENQLSTHTLIQTDNEVMILPENIPLMNQEDEETPTWHKVGIVGGLSLCFAMIMLLILRLIVR